MTLERLRVEVGFATLIKAQESKTCNVSEEQSKPEISSLSLPIENLFECRQLDEKNQAKKNFLGRSSQLYRLCALLN